MKKMFYSFVAAAMFVSVVACSGQNQEAASSDQAVETVDETATAPVEEATTPEATATDAAATDAAATDAAPAETAPADANAQSAQ